MSPSVAPVCFASRRPELWRVTIIAGRRQCANVLDTNVSANAGYSLIHKSPFFLLSAVGGTGRDLQEGRGDYCQDRRQEALRYDQRQRQTRNRPIRPNQWVQFTQFIIHSYCLIQWMTLFFEWLNDEKQTILMMQIVMQSDQPPDLFLCSSSHDDRMLFHISWTWIFDSFFPARLTRLHKIAMANDLGPAMDVKCLFAIILAIFDSSYKVWSKWHTS